MSFYCPAWGFIILGTRCDFQYCKFYFKVDNNVTRHIESEFSLSDWDVLILHYLGLDHIGHLAGPRSPLVQPKLNEMDGIIEDVYNKLLLEVY